MSFWAAALPAIGAGIGALFNYNSQRDTNQTNIDQAYTNRSFQAEMSNTAHRREMEDLKAAGLNPILTATGGAGASSPQGGLPTLQAPQINMPDMLTYGISLKNLEMAEERLKIDKAKLAIEDLNSKVDRQYKGAKTFLDTYGWQSGIARFMKELYNEKGENTSVNDILNGINKLKNNVQKPTLLKNKQEQEFETPNSLLGIP